MSSLSSKLSAKQTQVAVIVLLALMGTIVYTVLLAKPPVVAQAMSITWPQELARLSETQTFRVAIADSYRPDDVRVLWMVEGSDWSGEMQFDGSEFISDVDTTLWDWRRDNTYVVTFNTMTADNTVVASSGVTIITGQIAPAFATRNASFFENIVKDVIPEGSQQAAVAQSINNATVVAAQSFRTEWVPGPINNNQDFIFHTESFAEQPELTAFWSVEGGHRNVVYKEGNAKVFKTSINIFGWLWKGPGPYAITFSVADKTTSDIIASEVLQMYWTGKPGESEIQFRSSGVVISVPKPPVVVATKPPPVTNTTAPVLPAPTPKPPTTPPPVTPKPVPVKPTPVPSPKPLTPRPVPVAPSPTPIPPVIPPTTITPPPVLAQASGTVATIPTATTVFGTATLFVPTKPAVLTALTQTSDARQKAALTYILSQPSSVWLNGDAYETDDFIKSIIKSANDKNVVPSFVLYSIVNRDCNSYSSGGAKNAAAYKAWINRLAGVFKDTGAILVIEPDALSMLNCVAGAQQTERLELIRYAVTTLTSASARLLVYVDAGHPYWVNAEDMAARLRSVGIERARGFSLNVSSFASTGDNITYGNFLSNLIGGKHYIIDSSRNGNGRAPNGEWCNPVGRALGQSGTLYPGNKGVLDGVLWIKFPGESDGTCSGGPGAGQWWNQYATDLYTNQK